MENPWSNAWGDDKADAAPSWSVSTQKLDDDHEADIAIPSWSTGAATNWTEPSHDNNSLWSTADTSYATSWEAQKSPYEGINLAKSSTSLAEPPASSPSQQTPEPTPPSSPATSITDVEPAALGAEPADENSFESIHNQSPPPGSPDAFGTFETARVGDYDDSSASEDPPWTASVPTFPTDVLESGGWGAPVWSPREDSPEPPQEKPADEWETAIEQKRKQDQVVPPELLASILANLSEISEELWPPPDGGEQERITLDRLEDMAQFAPARNRLVPTDLTLPPLPPVVKSHASKNLTESIRLTRHVPFTHQSPMAHYLASKGSTAWEAAVRSRAEGEKDDVPAGWRLSGIEESPTPEVKKKVAAGFLSFFGRRAASPPVNGNPRAMVSSGSSSSRPSLDLQRTPSSSSAIPKEFIPRDITPASAPSSSSSPIVPALVAPVRTSSPGALSLSTPVADATSPAEIAREPTGVGRFLTRLSRPKSNSSSLALSSNDIEFLADAVPSASDAFDEDEDDRPLQKSMQRIRFQPTPPSVQQSQARQQSLLGDNVTHPKPDKEVSPPLDDDFALFWEKPIAQSSTEPSVPSDLDSFLAGTTSQPLVGPPSTSRTAQPPISTARSASNGGMPHSKRGFTAIMSSNSSKPTPSTIPKLGPAFNPLPPPPPPSTVPTTIQSRSLFDDKDAFNGFQPLPPPVPALLPSQASSSSLTSFGSLTSNRSAVTAQPDDDFDDFVFSPSIQTPSPPPIPLAKSPSRPPDPVAKSPPRVTPSPAPLRAISPPQQATQVPRSNSRAADHQRTLSLLETAASIPGRWPAPPSPIAPTLAPPPGLSFSTRPQKDINLFDNEEDSFGALKSIPPPKAMNGLMSSSFSSPAMLASPRTGTPQVPSIVGSQAPTTGGPLPKDIKSPGGLSAQDLSFFEGL